MNKSGFIDPVDAVAFAMSQFKKSGRDQCVICWGGVLQVVSKSNAQRNGLTILETITNKVRFSV